MRSDLPDATACRRPSLVTALLWLIMGAMKKLDAATKVAIKQYEREPTGTNALSLAAKLLVGDARTIMALIILLSCTWCASGLIAIDAATLWPSFLSPLLTHEQFSQPVTVSTMAVLFAAAPISHATGKFTLDHYKLWNPMKGGANFVVAQTEKGL